jgi:hypothetical protein
MLPFVALPASLEDDEAESAIPLTWSPPREWGKYQVLILMIALFPIHWIGVEFV